MYLIDICVISELRKKARCDPGVRRFFAAAKAADERAYLSVVTIGELRRGVELLRYRGDIAQAQQLACWLEGMLDEYRDAVLPFDAEVAQVWGRLRVPHQEHALDKQIAATALIHGLTVVTRNVNDFDMAGLRVLNPFAAQVR